MALTVAAALLALAIALWWVAGRLQRATGLPAARVRYDDSGAGRRLERPLVSHRHRLVGRPDYLLEDGPALVPVEVKPGRRSAVPYEGDVLQLAAYCLLVEEALGRRPPHGLLRYAERSWEVPFDEPLRRRLLATLAAMDRDRVAPDVHRSHDQPARCARCSQRGVCDERLDG